MTPMMVFVAWRRLSGCLRLRIPSLPGQKLPHICRDVGQREASKVFYHRWGARVSDFHFINIDRGNSETCTARGISQNPCKYKIYTSSTVADWEEGALYMYIFVRQ